MEAILIGAEEFLRPTLAPDARRIAAVHRRAGRRELAVFNLHGRLMTLVDIARGRQLQRYWWTGDGTGLFYTADQDGDERKVLYHVDLTTGATVAVTQHLGMHASLVTQVGATLWLAVSNDPNGSGPDLYRYPYRTQTARPELVVANPGHVSRWKVRTDELAVLAIGSVKSGEGGALWETVDLASDAWRHLLEVPRVDTFTTSPIRYTPTGVLARSSVGTDTANLVLYQAAGRCEAVTGRSDADVVHVSLDANGSPALVGYGGVRKYWQALTGEARTDLDCLTAERATTFTPLSNARASLLAEVVPTDQLPQYRYLARADRAIRTALPRFPNVEETSVPQTRVLRYLASDGLPLTAIHTQPEDGLGCLTIMLIHGGPWHRDELTFDPLVRWLAGLGYGCLQVNYRGSTGLGKRFVNAGDRQWGAAMQQDLVDVIAATAAEGLVRPDQIIAMGHSYGGYAALMLAATSALPVRGVVAQAPIIDLPEYLDWVRRAHPNLAEEFLRRIGNPDTEGDTLRHRSPSHHRQDLRCPVLLQAGDRDARIPTESVRRFGARLRQNGAVVEEVYFPDEGHLIVKRVNRAKFYRTVASFLATCAGRSPQ